MTKGMAPLAVALLVTGGTMVACAAGTGPHGPPSAVATASPAAVAASPAATRSPLPDGFPVLEGAMAVPLPADDPGVLGRWTTERVGSVAYDFYLVALPAAGYPVLGSYPGDAVAIVRFTAREGQPWQVVITALDSGQAQIEVRLDRP